MTRGRYAAFDEYGFRHFAADLCDLELYDELYEHTTSRAWLEAQTAFDPSRRTYADSLNWALRAAESDPDGLPALLTLSLLRPTVTVLAGQVPTAALEVMARLGEGEQAEAYAGLRRDPSSRCEALCRIAAGRSQRGDATGARETLLRARREAGGVGQPAARVELLCEIARALSRGGHGQEARESLAQAEGEALSLANPSSRTQKVGCVGLAAREIGAPDVVERTAHMVRTAFAEGEGPAPALARRLELLDRPDYLLLLAERQGAQERLGSLERDPLAVVAHRAAAQGDDALLDELLALARREPGDLRVWQIEAIAGALTEAGRADEAFALIEAWDPDPDLEVDLRGAVAKAAGRRGDLATIERAARLRPLRRRPALVDGSSDWGERLEDVKDRAGYLAKRAGWRLAGMGDWERQQVLLDGMDGLAQEHPEQARALWEQARAEGGWSWRRVAPLFEELYSQALGVGVTGAADGAEDGTAAQPSPMVGLLLRVTALAARWDPEAGEVLASFGRFDQALEAARKIEQPEWRANALAEIAGSALDMGDIARAMALVEAIESPETRRRQLDRVAEALAQRPHDEAMALLSPFAAQADRLDPQEALACTTALPALLRETARLGSVQDALDLVDGLGSDAILAALPTLGEVAMAQGDIEAAQSLLARAEQVGDGSAWVRALAQLSAGWAGAAAAGHDAALAARWTALATRAFHLAWSRAERLKPQAERRWLWPLLAQAARHLDDRKVLKTLHKRAKTLSGTRRVSDQALADQVLVHVIGGLTSPSPYLNPHLWEIHHREYRAQVLAEMSDALRRMPAQENRHDRESREFQAGLLLDQVQMHLIAPSFQSMMDEESVLYRLGRESQFPTVDSLMGGHSPEQRARLELSGREAVERAFEALARAGRYSDIIIAIASGTPQPSHQPVLAAAVKALAQAGQIAPARGLLPDIKVRQDTYRALAGLAVGLVAGNDPTAQALLEYLLSRAATLPEGALALAAEATLGLPLEAQWRILCMALRSGREGGRRPALAVVAALAPVASTLMGALRWREAVAKVLETETWFGLSQSLVADTLGLRHSSGTKNLVR